MWDNDRLKSVNDDAYNVCRAEAFIASNERKRAEANLKQILDKYFEDKERSEKDKKFVKQLNGLL